MQDRHTFDSMQNTLCETRDMSLNTVSASLPAASSQTVFVRKCVTALLKAGLCCAVLCCAELCCAALRWTVSQPVPTYVSGMFIIIIISSIIIERLPVRTRSQLGTSRFPCKLIRNLGDPEVCHRSPNHFMQDWGFKAGWHGDRHGSYQGSHHGPGAQGGPHQHELRRSNHHPQSRPLH